MRAAPRAPEENIVSGRMDSLDSTFWFVSSLREDRISAWARGLPLRWLLRYRDFPRTFSTRLLQGNEQDCLSRLAGVGWKRRSQGGHRSAWTRSASFKLKGGGSTAHPVLGLLVVFSKAVGNWQIQSCGTFKMPVRMNGGTYSLFGDTCTENFLGNVFE